MQFRVNMNNQQSQRKMLVESIKQSMIKPPSPQPKSNANKKPQNYESYLNTAIDYTKIHQATSPYLVASSIKKSQVVYNLDSDDSPKEDQHHKSNGNSNEFDEEMMKAIEMEILGDPNAQDHTPAQRKIVKPVGPKRKINHNDEEEAENESRVVPRQSLTRNMQMARKSRIVQEQYEQQKIATEEDERTQRPTVVRRKTCAYNEPYNPQSDPAKKLKQSMSMLSKPVKFQVNIPLLQGGLNIERIVDIKGSTREDIGYVCKTESGETVHLNNVEMTYLYKDVLIDYYQNILFNEDSEEK